MKSFMHIGRCLSEMFSMWVQVWKFYKTITGHGKCIENVSNCILFFFSVHTLNENHNFIILLLGVEVGKKKKKIIERIRKSERSKKKNEWRRGTICVINFFT